MPLLDRQIDLMSPEGKAIQECLINGYAPAKTLFEGMTGAKIVIASTRYVGFTATVSGEDANGRKTEIKFFGVDPSIAKLIPVDYAEPVRGAPRSE